MRKRILLNDTAVRSEQEMISLIESKLTEKNIRGLTQAEWVELVIYLAQVIRVADEKGEITSTE